MKKILIVSGHPDLNDSFANKTILEETKELLPEAEFACLDKLYPDFRIDVQAEQERLLRADIIVLQYPLFWYSAPSLLHRWMEQTFTHGFSHGRTGDKLRSKQLVLSFTSGAPEEMYPMTDRSITPSTTSCHLTNRWRTSAAWSGAATSIAEDSHMPAATTRRNWHEWKRKPSATPTCWWRN